MHRTVIQVDLTKEAFDQPQLHNRWHPDIPSAAKISPGEVVNIEYVRAPYLISRVDALTGQAARFITMIVRRTSKT